MNEHIIATPTKRRLINFERKTAHLVNELEINTFLN